MSGGKDREPDDAAEAIDAVPADQLGEELLAFRAWEWDPAAQRLRSVTHAATWAPGEDMHALCTSKGKDPEHVPPVKNCQCGIYCGTTITPVAAYVPPRRKLGDDDAGRIVGVVRTWGTVIPGTIGWRAEYARIGALLAISDEFTVSGEQLEIAAREYGVPLLTPHSAEPEEWRSRLGAIRKGLPDPFAGDLDDELRHLTEGRD